MSAERLVALLPSSFWIHALQWLWRGLGCLAIMGMLLACGGNTPSSAKASTTVTIKEAHGDVDSYSCDPGTITIKKGDTVLITNQTDEKQQFGGDAQKAGIALTLDSKQEATVTFSLPGTFLLTTQKGAHLTVTVQT